MAEIKISTETWKTILERIKEEFDIKEITYRTWLEPLTVYEVKNNTVFVVVTTGQMGIDYISKKFMSPLRAAIAEITGIEYEIEFILPEIVNGETPHRTEASRAERTGVDKKDKAFEQAMEDTISKIDSLVEQYDKARFRSTLALTLFGAVSLMAIWIGWNRHDRE